MLKKSRQNIRVQLLIVCIAIILFFIKIFAWYRTGSVAILTDALESIVNVVSAFIGLYSLYISAKPKDRNHPYGHGKIEFISASVEGVLILLAGIFIIYESIQRLIIPKQIQELDIGLILIVISAVVNYAAGKLAIHRGKTNHSAALSASGKHLITDTYSTIGIILGLALLYLTGWYWIDSVTAMLFGVLIITSGYKILRESLGNIMDEYDTQLITSMIGALNLQRRDNWVDLHNLRIIKYGSLLHVDCHLSLPWYFNVIEAHQEVDNLEQKVAEVCGENVELFVHVDACQDFSCSLCVKEDCEVRKSPLISRMEWTLENVISEERHRLV